MELAPFRRHGDRLDGCRGFAGPCPSTPLDAFFYVPTELYRLRRTRAGSAPDLGPPLAEQLSKPYAPSAWTSSRPFAQSRPARLRSRMGSARNSQGAGEMPEDRPEDSARVPRPTTRTRSAFKLGRSISASARTRTSSLGSTATRSIGTPLSATTPGPTEQRPRQKLREQGSELREARAAIRL